MFAATSTFILQRLISSWSTTLCLHDGASSWLIFLATCTWISWTLQTSNTGTVWQLQNTTRDVFEPTSMVSPSLVHLTVGRGSLIIHSSTSVCFCFTLAVSARRFVNLYKIFFSVGHRKHRQCLRLCRLDVVLDVPHAKLIVKSHL